MIYLWAQGWNVPLEDLLPIDPQPACDGLQHARRQFAASSSVIDEGPFWEFLYSTLGNGAIYKGLLTQSGLLVATTGPMTIYGPDENYDPMLRNCIIVKPLIGTDGKRTSYFLRDFVFLVHSLRPQA